MGRMKYRAARRRWRVRSDGATATALCPITSGCWRDDGATATAGLLPLPVAGEAGQRLLELGEAFLGLALSGERLVHGIPELAGHLVVFASRHARGPRHGVGESAEQLSDEGILRQDVLVLVERGDGRVEADLDGCALLLLGAGQVLGQVDRRLGDLRRLRQVLPGGGRLPPVLLEQVLAVVEEPGVGEGRQRYQLPAHGIRLDDGREVLGDDVLRNFLAQIHEVLGEQARPDDIDPDDVDLARLLREELLEQRELLVRVLRDRDDLHLVAGLLRPRLRPGLAEIELGADGTASNRDGALRSSGAGGKDRADANEGERGGEQDGETRSDGHGTSSRIPTSVSCGGERGEYQKRANGAKAPVNMRRSAARHATGGSPNRTVRRPSVSARTAVLAAGNRSPKAIEMRLERLGAAPRSGF